MVTGTVHRPTRRQALRTVVPVLAAAAAAGCTAPGGGPTAPTGGATAPATSSGPPPFAELSRALTGPLALPGDAGYRPQDLLYDPHRQVTADPQAVARCASAQDVAACVVFAAEHGVDLRLRNGGHSYSGASVGPGLVADLSALREVTLDRSAGTARVGGGSLLVDVYSAVGAAGAALGAGSCPTVGVSGLTLGGGVGVLTPSLGLTCDQVVSAEVVRADGTTATVDADSDPDLFWALRGGGAGLAAVTAWTFRVVPAPAVTTFSFRWDAVHAGEVLSAWAAWTAAAPRELWSTCKLLTTPADGARAQVSGTWVGSDPVDAVLDRLLRGLPAPVRQNRRDRDYLQAMLFEAGCSGKDPATCTTDALAPQQRLPFAATSSVLAGPPPEDAVRAVVANLRTVVEDPPAGLVEAGSSFDALGGAVADVAPDGSAFPWRNALATVQHTATSTADAAGGSVFDDLVERARTTLEPWAGGGAYLNYAAPTLPDAARACWGENLDRLAAVARTADPDGVLTGFPAP